MIKLNGVSFSYGDKEIFRNLNVAFPDSGLVVILGKSGSGKTTFLSLISGSLKPKSGSITNSFPDKPSLLFQSPMLLDYLNVEENVLLPLLFEGKRKASCLESSSKALREVSLQGFEKRAVKKLSGGEKTRVSLARALVKASSVLILDEPTGQLDEKNSLEIYEVIKKLAKERLIILVTHDEKNALNIADYLYELKEKNLILLSKREKDFSLLKKEKKPQGSLTLWESLRINSLFLLKRKARLVLTSLFLAFSLGLLYLGLNFKNELDYSLNSLMNSYYSSKEANITVKEKVASEGHLTLERYSTPSLEITSSLGLEECYPSFDYFVPEYYEVRIKDKAITASFQPVIEEDKSKLKEGKGFDNPYQVVINESFLSEIGLKKEEVLGKGIIINKRCLIYSSSFESSDLVSVYVPFRITGISKEKNAFNSASVYYDYRDIEELLAETLLKNISLELDEEVSILSLLQNPLYQNEDFGSRKLLFTSSRLSELKEKAEEIYGEEVSITSRTLNIKESTDQIVASLMEVALAFLALTLVSAFMLEFLSVYSLFDENIRLFALSKMFSDSKKNKKRIALGLGSLFLLLTVFFLLFISLLATKLINALLLKIYYPSFLKDFDFLSFAFVLFLSFLVTLLGSLLPLKRIKDSEIKKELEGED